MKLEDIYKFFENPPPTYLCPELAVCYILSILLEGDSYGTELIQKLETEYPTYRLSDTVLYTAIKCLEDEKVLTGYWTKLEGRGRPRRMYQVSPEWEEEAKKLTSLWQEYINQQVNNDFDKKIKTLYKYYSQQYSQNKRSNVALKIESIYQFFQNPPPTSLSLELAICCILSILLNGESYGTELIKIIESEYPDYQITDTKLYTAIKFLEDEKALAGYWKQLDNRSRPRKMYLIAAEKQEYAKDLARLWENFVNTLERAEVLNAVGNDYNCSGEFNRAIGYYQKALIISQRIDYRIGQITSLKNLADIYHTKLQGNKIENIERAIEIYTTLLKKINCNDSPEEWASVCLNIANLYIAKVNRANLSNLEILDNIEDAIFCYEDALNIYTSDTFPQESAIIQEKLQEAYQLIEHCRSELQHASLPQPISRNKALARIELKRTSILDLEVDAIIRPTDINLSFTGDISRQIFERFDITNTKWYKKLLKKTISVGEVFVTDASSMLCRYLFHTPIDNFLDTIISSIIIAFNAALTQADSIGDIKTIAFPSVGTGALGLNPADLAPKILKTVVSHLESGSRLEKVIFAFIDEHTYQCYLRVYQALTLEDIFIYQLVLSAPRPMAVVAEETEVVVYLKQVEAIQEGYFLQIPRNEAVGAELNIFLTAPGFQINGDNTASIPLDPNTNQLTQTARFRLTALRPGTNTITTELYRGDAFDTKLETSIQVTNVDEANLTTITTQPRPVPQPDFILQVKTVWNLTSSTCSFQYIPRSFRFPSMFTANNVYNSESLSSSWLEQVKELLASTLENIPDSLPAEGTSRLISLGKYLFRRLFSTDLQSDFRTLIPRNSTFTLLILADEGASIPWELLHDGQSFFGERFIIGRWLRELNDTRPYEFPVGAVNVAHYANVEQPELWANLLEARGAPLPNPLLEGVLNNLDSTEAMRGLHLIRYAQADTASNAPVRVDNTDNTEDIELQVRPVKLNLRRNRPLVSLSYVKTDITEITNLEANWAATFIRAGCSAFIGALWSVSPNVEAAFIGCFYNRLWAGDSIGKAFDSSRKLACAVAPDSLDWLAYVLFADPMARPYRPVEGKGYAVVEPIGREVDEPVIPGIPIRFRLSLRRTPPVWHEERVIEVAENLSFENLQVHVKTFGLQVNPDSVITMNLALAGNYIGWFTLMAPVEMANNSAVVQVYFMDGIMPIHSIMFSLNIASNGGDAV